MNEFVRRAYDRAGSAYASWKWGKIWDVLEKPSILPAIPTGGRILDAGCGYGRYAPHLAALGLSYWGVDLSNAQIALARSRNSLMRTRFAVADICKLPFIDATFDAILLTRVLNHGMAGETVAAELARVLRPGGLLVATDFSARHSYSEPRIVTDAGAVVLPTRRYPRCALLDKLRANAIQTLSIKELLGPTSRPLLDVIVARKAA